MTKVGRKSKHAKKKQIKGGTNEPYFYLHVTKGGQLIPQSIESIHIEQFLKCLHQSIALQKLLQKHRIIITNHAGPLYRRKIQPFLSNKLNIKTIINRLDSEIINFTANFVGVLQQKQNTQTTQKRTPFTQPPAIRAIRVKGGADDGILRSIGKFISSAVILVASAFVSPQSPPSITHFQHSDYRRTIVGIIFPESQIRCIAKCTNDDSYIASYEQEAEMYRFFERQNEQYVCPFYGAGNGRTLVNGAIISMSLPMPLRNGDTMTQNRLSIEVQRNRFKGDAKKQTLYVLFTEWNSDYWTLEDALNNPLSVVLRNTHLRNVMHVTGYLNNKYGFFHGDLKHDNIMVKKDGTGVAVRCFDFDWSGIIGLIRNKTVLDYFEPYPPQKIKDYISGKKQSHGKIFFLIFDAYRLFISWIWTLSSTGRFDVFNKKCRDGTCINKIVIKNDFIQFTIQNLIDYLKFYTTCRADCTIENVQRVISKKYNLNTLNWNVTLMHRNVIMNLFSYIMRLTHK